MPKSPMILLAWRHDTSYTVSHIVLNYNTQLMGQLSENLWRHLRSIEKKAEAKKIL